MSKYPNDDLFEGTKMTFGEHLEELRVALVYSVIWLVAGVCVGLLVGDRIVKWIQTPLVSAMEKYYLQQAEADVIKKQGIEKLPAELHDAIWMHRVKPVTILIDRNEAERVAELVRTMPPPPPLKPVTPAEETMGEPARPAEEPKPSAAPASSAPPTETPATAPTGSVATVAIPQAVDPDWKSPSGFQPIKPTVPDRPQFIWCYIWEPVVVKVSALSTQESFMIYLQAAVVAGILIASPGIFWHIWDFVRAGLYPHEQSYVYTFLPISLGLFLGGAALAFFAVFPPVLEFLLSYNRAIEVDPDPRISEWIGFVLMLPIGFGIAFQLPLVMFFIERIGIISVDSYLSYWRIAILIIVVLSAVLTPADPISLLLMATPLVFLYYAGIGLCMWLPHFRKPFAETYEP